MVPAGRGLLFVEGTRGYPGKVAYKAEKAGMFHVIQMAYTEKILSGKQQPRKQVIQYIDEKGPDFHVITSYSIHYTKLYERPQQRIVNGPGWQGIIVC